MQTTEGIVLKTTPLAENAELITLLSYDFGVIAFCLKQKSRSQQISPLVKLEVSVTASQRELWKCRDSVVISSYQKIRTHLQKLQAGSYLLSFISKVLPTQTAVPSIYRLVENHLQLLGEAQYADTILTSFLLRFLGHEGFLPPTYSKEAAEFLMIPFEQLIGQPISSQFATKVRVFAERKMCERGDLNPYEENLTTTSK